MATRVLRRAVALPQILKTSNNGSFSGGGGGGLTWGGCGGGCGGGQWGSPSPCSPSGSRTMATSPSASPSPGILIQPKATPKGTPYFARDEEALRKQTEGKIRQEPTLEELMAADETLESPDYFQVHKLFTVKELFEARVHLGHKTGALDPGMTDFVFGSRFESCIIDLDKTAFHLRQALNFLAHVAYRKGIILFVTRSPHVMHLVEDLAIQCGEYAHCRDWDSHTLTNSSRKYGGTTRLPDTIVLLNCLNTVMDRHRAVLDAAKMLIPTVGVVDTNCNPNLITYPIPGNDDSVQSIQLYCKLFKEAILRGKNKRKQVDAQRLQDMETDKTAPTTH